MDITLSFFYWCKCVKNPVALKKLSQRYIKISKQFVIQVIVTYYLIYIKNGKTKQKKEQKKKQKQIKHTHTHTHTHTHAKTRAQKKIAHCSANLIYFVNVLTYFIPNKLPKKVKNLPVALQLLEIQCWSHNTAAHILLVFYYRPIASTLIFFKKSVFLLQSQREGVVERRIHIKVFLFTVFVLCPSFLD